MFLQIKINIFFSYSDYEFWDLLNFSNLKVSYGLYTYVVEIPAEKNQKGKFVILR